MTSQEREAAALKDIQAALDAHHCTLKVNAVPNQQLELADGTVMIGTRYLVAVQALPETAATAVPPAAAGQPPRTASLSRAERRKQAVLTRKGPTEALIGVALPPEGGVDAPVG